MAAGAFVMFDFRLRATADTGPVKAGQRLTWSAVFLILYERSDWLRRVVASPLGVLKIAAVYGPLVWVVMSVVVIPTLTGRPTAITIRWWIQFFGHAIFVGLPIVAMIARPRQRERLNANSA